MLFSLALWIYHQHSHILFFFFTLVSTLLSLLGECVMRTWKVLIPDDLSSPLRTEVNTSHWSVFGYSPVSASSYSQYLATFKEKSPALQIPETLTLRWSLACSSGNSEPMSIFGHSLNSRMSWCFPFIVLMSKIGINYWGHYLGSRLSLALMAGTFSHLPWCS